MIDAIDFLEILDGQGEPTLLAILSLKDGQIIKATAPSRSLSPSFDQASTRYQGKGLKQMIQTCKPILQESLKGRNLKEVDPILIELKDLGTNFTGAISIACLKAEALLNQKTIYESLSDQIKMPQIIVEVTPHFMIVPVNTKPTHEHIRMVHDIFYILEDIALEKRISLYDPRISYDEKIETLLQAIEEAGFGLGRDIGLFLNLEGLAQYLEGQYFFDHVLLDPHEYIERLVEDLKRYPIIGYENVLSQKDPKGWSHFSNTVLEKIKRQVLIASSHNLDMTNITMAIPAFEGTISETLENITQKSKDVIVQQTQNATSDTFVVDFALGLQAPFVKFGNIKQRDAYNRLLEIESLIS